MPRTIAIMIMVSLLLGMSSANAAEGDGGYAGTFMQVPIGARPAAMGGAYLAVSNDGAGALYNPAGLATLQRPLFATSYRLMKLDRTLVYASVILPARGNSALGVQWLYGGSGSLARRNYDGDDLGDEIQKGDHQFAVTFSKRFENFFAAGIKLSYLHSSFAEMTAYSVGIDVGLMFYLDWFMGRENVGTLPIDDLQVGLTLKHLDAKYIWNNETFVQTYVDGTGVGSEQEDEVPLEFGLGMSGRLLERKLLLSSDIYKNTKQGLAFHSGAEYFLKPEFAIRTGFSDGSFTAGTGYIFSIGKQVLAIDYAFSTDKAGEGSEHIFSFDLLF